MKCIVIDRFGGPDVFVEREIERPVATEGHVVVRVVATSVNPLDYKIRSGAMAGLSPAFPAILHGDVAGYVEEVGPGVTGFSKGDEVYGCVGGVAGTQGALAEFVKADVQLLARKPQSLSMAEAAALPLVSITAWEALIDRAQIKSGQRVLIHGATGGVAHIAIQLAKSVGARVYATASSEAKLEIARRLGADEAIAYRRETVEQYTKRCTDGAGFDVVFDTVGGETLDASFKAVALCGKVASILSTSSYDLSTLFLKNGTLENVCMLIPLLYGKGRERHGQILTEMARLVDEGKVKPLIDTHRFNFSEVGKAHALCEQGKAIGKVVLMNQ